MSYRLEVAFNLRYTGSVTQLQNDILELADDCGCERSYVDIEFQGCRRRVTRNHVVLIFYFPENPKHLIDFLHFIKKSRKLYIESIGFDNCRFTLLYASKTYLTMMDKYKAKEYLNNKNKETSTDFMRVIKAV